MFEPLPPAHARMSQWINILKPPVLNVCTKFVINWIFTVYLHIQFLLTDYKYGVFSMDADYGWPFVAKFSNVYLYATIYIDSTLTQDIFIQRLIDSTSTRAIIVQDKYLFNFNAQSFMKLWVLKFLWNEYSYSTSTKNIFIQQNIFFQLFKFPDIEEDMRRKKTVFPDNL